MQKSSEGKGLLRLIPNNEKLVMFEDLRLARMAQRDRPTAERMLRRLQPKILQVILAAVQSEQEVTEIAQSTALEVLKSVQNYRGEGSLEAWAGGIAYRVTMRSLKRLRTRERRHVSIFEGDSMDYTNPETELSRRQLFDSLSEKMEKIPAKRRTPILLHLVNGYTVDELAEMMNISPNTIKDRLKTALRELRVIVDKNPSLRDAMLEVIR